jgi:hypothetical protein
MGWPELSDEFYSALVGGLFTLLGVIVQARVTRSIRTKRKQKKFAVG